MTGGSESWTLDPSCVAGFTAPLTVLGTARTALDWVVGCPCISFPTTKLDPARPSLLLRDGFQRRQLLMLADRFAL